MKLVFLMTDTFRRDHIGAYGNKHVRTPNLDRLAAMGNLFEQYTVASFPTGPNRRDMHLGLGNNGRFNKWTPMTDEEIPLAQRLGEKGVHTMMVNDTANCVSKGRNYQKGFNAWYHNRGQEGDPWWSDDTVPLTFPVPPELIRYDAERWHQIQITASRRRVEDDWFAGGTYKVGCEWLERNYRRDNFMVWIETFDPHEPWDPPQWYVDQYDPDYDGRVFTAPIPGLHKKMGITDREMKHIHARYCGECSMVDTAVGRVLGTLEKLGLLDEVAIVFTTDHGSFFGLEGDYGLTRKSHYVPKGGFQPLGQNPGIEKLLPMLPALYRIPLMIKLPHQKKAKRLSQIAQPFDITPTVLDLFGMPAPPEFNGRSLLPLMEGKARATRPYAFTCGQAGVYQASNKDWLYATFSQSDDKPWLMDLKNYPKRYDNVADEHPDVCGKMRKALLDFEPLAAGPEGE